MARESYVFDPSTGNIVPKHVYRAAQPRPLRSHLSAPMIVSDHIAGGISQVSGRYHESRSTLMQDYRDYEARTGQRLEIVGDQTHHIIPDDTPTPADEKGIEAAISQALEMHDA